MKTLDLSYNAFDTLHSGQFDNSSNLEALSLSHNRIKILPNKLFSCLPKLNVLDVSHNVLKSFKKRALFGINRGTECIIDIEGNRLSFCKDFLKFNISSRDINGFKLLGATLALFAVAHKFLLRPQVVARILGLCKMNVFYLSLAYSAFIMFSAWKRPLSMSLNIETYNTIPLFANVVGGMKSFGSKMKNFGRRLSYLFKRGDGAPDAFERILVVDENGDLRVIQRIVSWACANQVHEMSIE